MLTLGIGSSVRLWAEKPVKAVSGVEIRHPDGAVGLGAFDSGKAERERSQVVAPIAGLRRIAP